jgi:protein involved in polysaccharide export with SLBB domain
MAGCVTHRATQSPLLTQVNNGTGEAATAEYRLRCPDIVELRFTRKPEHNAIASIDVDGRLPLGTLGEVVAQDRTVGELREAIALKGGMAIEDVNVQIYDARSQRLTIFGPERNRQRSVSYRGPERVLDLLRRTGALQPGCSNPRELTVVRANVAVGAAPAVLRVDLEAIVERGEEETNVLLEPNDQVHVGELRRSSLYRLLPEWLKPIYRKWMGMLPSRFAQ